MKSNTLNPIELGTPAEVVNLLQDATQYELTESQREDVEIIIKNLGAKATILNFVKAASNTPGLKQFGLKVGVFLLPGEGYVEIYEREFGSLVS